jgi:hypothetical protein
MPMEKLYTAMISRLMNRYWPANHAVFKSEKTEVKSILVVH